VIRVPPGLESRLARYLEWLQDDMNMTSDSSTTLEPLEAAAESADAVSLTERAYRIIKDRIMDATWGPGFNAFEPDIAEQLGFSRTPVREALVRLEEEGLITLVPRRGVFVTPLAEDDISDTYFVLAGLEAMAAELIAKGTNVAQVLEQMSAALLNMDASLERGDLRAWADADADFHHALVNGANNRKLAELASLVTGLAMRARFVTLPYRTAPKKSQSEHHMMMEAISNGDWKLAAKITRQHRLNGLQTILKALRRMPKRSDALETK
jgi:DNA-binding GntR family transcriptional regulator